MYLKKAFKLPRTRRDAVDPLGLEVQPYILRQLHPSGGCTDREGSSIRTAQQVVERVIVEFCGYEWVPQKD